MIDFLFHCSTSYNLKKTNARQATGKIHFLKIWRTLLSKSKRSQYLIFILTFFEIKIRWNWIGSLLSFSQSTHPPYSPKESFKEDFVFNQKDRITPIFSLFSLRKSKNKQGGTKFDGKSLLIKLRKILWNFF